MFQFVLNIHTNLISLFLGFWDIWDIDQMEPNCSTTQGTMKNSVMKHVPTLKVHFLNFPGHSVEPSHIKNMAISSCQINMKRKGFVSAQLAEEEQNKCQRNTPEKASVMRSRPHPRLSEQCNSLPNKRRHHRYKFHSTLDNLNVHDHCCLLVIKALISSAT
jgi:hypothetical protein